MFKNALVSCSDKSGLPEFLKALQKKGLRIVSTGGTAQLLRNSGLDVVDVSAQTGFPEVMDGRVKTLHPKIHMALLARDDDAGDLSTLRENKIEPFDLVIGNLYPFEEEPSVDTIDIGGPSFLRAAAKSFSRIAVVCDPRDYSWIIERETLTVADRQKLAAKVFAHTASYDAMIARYYVGDDIMNFHDHSLGGALVQSLRYGENPHQKANWYRARGAAHGLHQAKILQGKELSYNNLLDIEAAVTTARLLTHGQAQNLSAVVAVKHNSPCGVAVHNDAQKALENALLADPQSVFGGILASSSKVTGPMAELMKPIFLECVVAPQYDEAALQIFSAKKNLRILEWPQLLVTENQYQYRSISGGFLVQEKDNVDAVWGSDWVTHGEIPNEGIKRDLIAAWAICAALKSNAIAIVSAGQTIGLGMGQVNRVDAVSHAIERSQRFHPDAKNKVLASDAFFPFPDSIEKIAEAGIRYVIQPAGSIKDADVLNAAKKLGVTIVMTNQRHFLH